jgi:hypothetical protein
MTGCSVKRRSRGPTLPGHLWPILLAGVIAGCATVSSVAPMGERPKELAAEEWAGTWIHQGQALVFRVVDPRNGMLDVAWVEEKGGALRLESYRVSLRESGDWMFGNAVDPGYPGRYFWALVRKEAKQILVWTPDPDQCAKLVKAGVLTGKVEEGGDVILGKLDPAQTRQLLSSSPGNCLRWAEPVVLFRLGSGSD